MSDTIGSGTKGNNSDDFEENNKSGISHTIEVMKNA